MCARRSGSILFYVFADNFTGSKDTEPYKTDVPFFVSIYILWISSFYVSCHDSEKTMNSWPFNLLVIFHLLQTAMWISNLKT